MPCLPCYVLNLLFFIKMEVICGRQRRFKTKKTFFKTCCKDVFIILCFSPIVLCGCVEVKLAL